MKISLILILVYILCGCSASTSKLSDRVDEQSNCPLSLPVDRQEYQLNFKSIMPPNKISVVYNGIEKYNSCSSVVQERPVVYIAFNKTNPMINISVKHFGAFPQLPLETSLEITDLENCDGQTKVIFKENSIPLSFSKEIIGPSECGLVENVARIPIVFE